MKRLTEPFKVLEPFLECIFQLNVLNVHVAIYNCETLDSLLNTGLKNKIKVLGTFFLPCPPPKEHWQIKHALHSLCGFLLIYLISRAKRME